MVYDSASRRTTLTLPKGLTVAYSYDNDSRVSGITYTAAGGAQLGNLGYSYDANGRRTAMGGSLAAVNLPAAVSGNTFNADNEMTSFNGTTLSHDADGNLTSDGTNSYTWDARNHLTGISGGASASFVYDAFGRRVSKTINGATTQFLYDGWNPVQELNGSNPPTPTANLLTGLGLDEYFMRTDTNGAMSFLTDALGSTVGLVDSSGTLATQYTYEPFGKTTVSGSNTNPYQFTGRENDGTGLYYDRARYYTFQRFVAQDPIGVGGSDLYAYVYNDPTNVLDPLGLYGTSSCNYYTQDCSANGSRYSCYVAKHACNFFPKTMQVSNCMRQCLQEQNLRRKPEPHACSSTNRESPGSITSDHALCAVGCVRNSQNPYSPNGPPLPDKDINLY